MTITFKQRIPPFPAERLEAISKVLGDTNEGWTGSEIDHLIRNCEIPKRTDYHRAVARRDYHWRMTMLRSMLSQPYPTHSRHS